MGDSKVEKGDMHDFARRVGQHMRQLEMQIASLNFALDCLVSVLGNGDAVKSEMERRHAEAKAKAEAEKTPKLVPVP